MKYTLHLKNVEETITLGKILGSFINSKFSLALDGDLGCGKTHFTRGLALGLNIDQNITSPTFTLINEYYDGRLNLYHFDVYRLKSIDELYMIGFEEYLKHDGVIVIEWASLIKKFLPDNFNYINIYKIDSNYKQRKVDLDFCEKDEQILKQAINIFEGGLE